MENLRSKLSRDDKIKLQKHKQVICDELHNIEATLQNLRYDTLINFVHKNLKDLQLSQPNLKNKEANEVFKAWTERKKRVWLRMQENLKPKKAFKRERENDDKENQPPKKRYFQSGIDALLAAAAELDGNENKHNTSDFSEKESHLDLSTEMIDLSKAIKHVSKASSKAIDLSLAVQRPVSVRRTVFAVNGCLFGNPRKPVLWKRPDNSQQQQHRNMHIFNTEYQQNESSNESSREDSNFLESDTDAENISDYERRNQLRHTPLSHSTPHAATRKRVVAAKHGEIKSKPFKPTLAVPLQEVTAAESCQIEDFILIGPNGTIIPKLKYDRINWRQPTTATRSLMLACFPEEHLARHCLSGKPSPAFIGRGRPTKGRLDPVKIADIIHCVVNQLRCSEREVKQAITTQCADTSKKMTKLMKKQLQGN